ncbi:Uncharacterised protein [Escherichia coli]|nr:Uncharacterised protein [Escherichia coli]
MNPLFNDIQMRLFHLNHSPYSWYWNVRFIPLEAVYIGNDTCHITITCNRDNLPLLYQTETFLKTLSDLLP